MRKRSGSRQGPEEQLLFPVDFRNKYLIRIAFEEEKHKEVSCQFRGYRTPQL